MGDAACVGADWQRPHDGLHAPWEVEESLGQHINWIGENPDRLLAADRQADLSPIITRFSDWSVKRRTRRFKDHPAIVDDFPIRAEWGPGAEPQFLVERQPAPHFLAVASG